RLHLARCAALHVTQAGLELGRHSPATRALVAATVRDLRCIARVLFAPLAGGADGLDGADFTAAAADHAVLVGGAGAHGITGDVGACPGVVSHALAGVASVLRPARLPFDTCVLALEGAVVLGPAHRGLTGGSIHAALTGGGCFCPHHHSVAAGLLGCGCRACTGGVGARPAAFDARTTVASILGGSFCAIATTFGRRIAVARRVDPEVVAEGRVLGWLVSAITEVFRRTSPHQHHEQHGDEEDQTVGVAGHLCAHCRVATRASHGRWSKPDATPPGERRIDDEPMAAVSCGGHSVRSKVSTTHFLGGRVKQGCQTHCRVITPAM